MPVDNALRALSKPIESGQPWPRPRCPDCDSGHIRFGDPTEAESHASASLRDHPGFDSDWIRGTFAVRGECENPSCRQTVHGTGDYYVGDAKDSFVNDPWQNKYVLYSAYYRVTYLHPALHLMPVPQSAPEEVRDGLRRASRVLFADAGLAATALRATVELFLTREGIPATNSSGRFRNAHTRIKEWGDADSDRVPVAKLLFAVKWLGNAGTHEDSDLTTAEVLEGASLLDEAFHRHYTGPDIDARARSINTAKGPSRPS